MNIRLVTLVKNFLCEYNQNNNVVDIVIDVGGKKNANCE